MQRRYEYRRKLPQFQPDHKVFFITFSTYKRRILPEAVRQIVIETCLAGNGKKFRLYGVVVMPDHVHLVLSPLSDPNGSFSIAEIMQAIKGASAHRINRALRRKGKVWEEESFDRVLRREETSVTSSITFSGTPLGQGWCEIPLSIAGCGEIRANWVACPEPTGEDTRPPSNYIYRMYRLKSWSFTISASMWRT